MRALNFLADSFVFIIVQLLVFKVRLQSNLLNYIFNEPSFLGTGISGFYSYKPHFIGGSILFAVLGIIVGIYSGKIYLSVVESAQKAAIACGLWTIIYLFAALFFKIDPPISRSFVLLVGLIASIALICWKILLRQIIVKSSLTKHLESSALLVGDGEGKFIKRLAKNPIHGLTITESVVLANPHTTSAVDGTHFRKVSMDELEERICSKKFDVLLLAEHHMEPKTVSYLIQLCHRELVQFMMIPLFFEVMITGLHLKIVNGVPLVSLGRAPLDRFLNRLVKRLVDIVGAIVGLLIFGPVILLFSVLVFRESPGPVFYAQTRAGRGGKKFKMYKIRSMRLDAEKDHGPQWAKENDGRRLIIGSFMRSWNIDELPQFWNVLKGDMSLVGPRPERPVFIKEFKHRVGYYNLRHSVKPGITGWAAINGWRGNTDLDERIRFDLDYIEHWSLWFDFQIMILTFFRNKNAY